VTQQQDALFIIYTDGACRGNPGPASIGAVLYVDDPAGAPISVAEISETIGDTTNNVAEYRAVIAALERAHILGAIWVELRTDSELLTKQINGEYRVKNAGLRPLYETVQRLRTRFRSCEVVHVRREQNREADALANAALDNQKRHKRR